MAIIPSRDNFQVGVQPFGARVSGAPAPADVTRNTRVLAQGLMAADRMADDKAKTDATDALSRYQENLDRLRYDQNDGFTARKGKAANENADGSSVWEEYQNRVMEARNAVTEGMSPDALRYFDRQAGSLTNTFNRGLMSHQASEDRQYKNSTFQSRDKQLQQNFVMAISGNDIDGIARSVADAKDNTLEWGRLSGWSAGEVEQKMKDWQSGALSGAITQLLADGQTADARDLYEKNKMFMTASDLLVMGPRLHTAESKKAGENAADTLMANPVYIPGERGKVYRSTAFGESGGRRYSNGTVLVSPKGAMGEYQVMPATAESPGFGIAPSGVLQKVGNGKGRFGEKKEWDFKPEALKQYGLDGCMDRIAAVGTAYQDKLIEYYKGDLARMWGAYNAGPGTVDKLINQYGNDWLSHAPDETRKYVKGNLDFYAKSTDQAAYLPDARQIEALAKQMFPDNELAQNAMISKANRNVANAKAADRQADEQTMMTLYQHLSANDGDIGSIPDDMLPSDPKQLKRLYTYSRDIQSRKYATQSDLDVLAELSSDDTLVSLSQPELMEKCAKLTRSHANRVMDRWARLKGGGTVDSRYGMTRPAKAWFDAQIRDIGYRNNSKEKADLRDLVNEAIMEESARTKRALSADEQKSVINRVLTGTVHYESSALGGIFSRDYSRKIYQIGIDDVPEDIQKTIAKELDIRGIPDTEQNILRTYQLMKVKNG